ncbi:MAG: hypothetical protein AB1649_13035 [Chloroflexota bacterium]
MRSNELLYWLSARREGSWQQFRAAIEELYSNESDSEENGNITPGEAEFPLHQRLRIDLERLGHAEFFACGCEKGWRVAPPTLAAHPVSGGVRAVLCGARSPGLRERALQAGEKVDCEVEVLDSHNVPQVIRFITPGVLELQHIASQIGAHFQADAPLAILSYLPSCDPPSRGSEQAEFPVGVDWRIREFDAVNIRWHTTDRQRAQTAHTGLFEFQLYDRWRYFLRWKGGTFEMPRAVALYVLLRRRRRLLLYDAQAGTLSLPGTCRPPRLIERALVLCSGIPPSFDPTTVRLTYADIPPDIAHFVAESLRQQLT